jgi:hypothetical protein
LFRPGQVIARRYRMRHITTWAQAAVVVSDDDAGLLLWQPPGAECALYAEPAGRSIADAPIDELVGASLVSTTWQRYGVLIAERVAGLATAGAYPFDGTHCGFRPDPAWDVPSLPVGWDQPPVLSHRT